jgi:hypothetical protein
MDHCHMIESIVIDRIIMSFLSISKPHLEYL